jgi:hypothetical protein
MLAFVQQFLPEGAVLRDVLISFAGPILAAVALLWCVILQVRLASAGAELRRLRRSVRGLEAAESQRTFEYLNRAPAEAEPPAIRVRDAAEHRYPLAAE